MNVDFEKSSIHNTNIFSTIIRTKRSALGRVYGAGSADNYNDDIDFTPTRRPLNQSQISPSRQFNQSQYSPEPNGVQHGGRQLSEDSQDDYLSRPKYSSYSSRYEFLMK